jgi:diguanylate cyclase (GGDEF)-like protein/PAS domain S-box-containing protein
MDKRGKVLIVGDDRESAAELGTMLARLEYEIESFASGVEALSALADGSHDVVLLDAAPPEMSGLESLSAVRGLRGASDLPVIMIAAMARSEDVVEALSLGANDYVLKPVDSSVIHSRIMTQISLSRAERALRLSEERYALAAAATRDGLWDWRLAEDRLFVSSNWRAITGLASESDSITREDWMGLLHHADREVFEALLSELERGERDRLEAECRVRWRDGSIRWTSVRGILVRDARGRPQRIAGAMSDVTDGKFYHSLTRLPTVALLQERIDRYLEAGHDLAWGAAPSCLVFIDLDGFRFINQAYGHQNGDAIIKSVAARIKSALGPRDALAHYGRDEFLALFEGLSDPARIVDKVGLILERIQAPVPSEDGKSELVVTACAGVAVLDGTYASSNRAIQDAESAMHMAKRDGTNRYRFFLKDYYDRIKEKLEREKDLRMALKNRQFALFYQPQVRVTDGRLTGFEALIRRIDPEGGIIMPDRFIPLAEENGMIGKLGEWILRSACSQIKEWDDAGVKPPRVAVNLSPIQFNDDDLAATLTEIIRSTGIDPGILELEITESKAMENPVETIRIMEKLKEIGVSFSIDDFGTGYSSLSMLQRFPLSTLKIDKAFINGVPGSDSAKSIVEAIIALSQSLRFATIAEGVESDEQLQYLKAVGCEMYQGYYMSGAVNVVEATAFLHKHHDAVRP